MKLKLYSFLTLLFISISSVQAQDYLISFAGSGASSTVVTVNVENLTRGTSLSMNGSDVLHLNVTTGIETVSNNIKDNVSFYPNPMRDFSRMRFDLAESGETIITIYDISGRKITQKRDLLLKGQHYYCIKGVGTGIYFVRVSSGKYLYSGRLVCSGRQDKTAEIVYENTVALQEKQSDPKGTDGEVIMQYVAGDRLKFTGISGNYRTIVTDIPVSSKTVTFNFIACNDADNNNYPVVKIGIQVWMAENLKTTKYSNGDLIGTTTPATLNTHGEASPKYQWAYGGDENNVATYGRLYTWYAVVDTRMLCPAGWHAPIDAEWTTLKDYLIANGYNYDGTTTGDKIAKALASTTLWQSDWHAGDVGNNDYPAKRNASGFTAPPGGWRDDYGAFGGITQYCYFWSASQGYMVNQSWFINMWYYENFTGRNIYFKGGGYSVRCLKD
jgi:uncharacterized protein (TIGR02145 family)